MGEKITKHEQEMLDGFQKILDGTTPPDFNENVVDVGVIDQEIEYQQRAYLQEVLACEEESKLADENLEDLQNLPKKKKARVIDLAMKKSQTQDPNFFQNNKVEKDLMYPIQQAEAILTKAQEVKRHEWSIDYRARLVAKLRNYRERISDEETIKLSFVERLKALVFGEVIRYLKKQ